MPALAFVYPPHHRSMDGASICLHQHSQPVPGRSACPFAMPSLPISHAVQDNSHKTSALRYKNHCDSKSCQMCATSVKWNKSCSASTMCRRLQGWILPGAGKVHAEEDCGTHWLVHSVHSAPSQYLSPRLQLICSNLRCASLCQELNSHKFSTGTDCGWGEETFGACCVYVPVCKSLPLSPPLINSVLSTPFTIPSQGVAQHRCRSSSRLDLASCKWPLHM